MSVESASEAAASVARVPIIRVDEVVRSLSQMRIERLGLKGLH